MKNLFNKFTFFFILFCFLFSHFSFAKTVEIVASENKNTIISPGMVLTPVKSITEKFTFFYNQLDKELQVIPDKINKLKSTIISQTDIKKLPYYQNFLIVSIIIGLGLFFISRLIARKLKLSYQKKGDIPVPEKINTTLILSVIRIIPGLLLYLFLLLAVFFIQLPKPLDYLSIRILFSLIIYTFSKEFFYALFKPNMKEMRVIPISNKSAAFTTTWVNRVLLFSLIMFVLFIINYSFKQFAFALLIAIIYKAGLSLFAIILLSQIRKPTEKKLFIAINKNNSVWKNRFIEIYNFILQKLFPLIILDVWVLLILSVINDVTFFNYLFANTIKTLALILLTYGLVYLLGFVVTRVFEFTKSFEKKLPEFIKQTNYSLTILNRIAHIIIILFSMFILFEIWGIDIYKPLQSNIYIVIKILQILFLLLVGFLALQGSKFIIHKLKEEAVNRMGKFRKVSKGETEKRATTLASLSQKTINIAIFVIISMMILTALGIDIKPILGGVGILGLAVGFGAQNLVRDIISGLFLIFEDQIRVGDVAIINGTGGLVEQVNLRITVLRGLDGTVHIFPNGMITTLSNMTHDYSFYLMDIGVAYKENVDNVIEVIKQLGTEMEADENYGKFILEPMEILGLDKFADSAIIIKARIKTVPIQQWFIGREFNRRMKNRFDELGIEIPFPHMTFYFGDASKPVKVENNTQNLDEKKLMELLEKISKEKKKS